MNLGKRTDDNKADYEKLKSRSVSGFTLGP